MLDSRYGRGVITAVHALIFSTDPNADRAFPRDVLGLPYVDSGGGWLIFKLPPAEVGVHPSDGERRTDLRLICDDLDATLADLRGWGVEVTRPVTSQQYGMETALRLPGGGEVGLYQPTHPTAYDL